MTTLMSDSELENLAKLVSAITIDRARNKPIEEKSFRSLFWFESQRNIDIAELLCSRVSEEFSISASRNLFNEYIEYALSQTRHLQKWWIRDTPEKQLARINLFRWLRRHKFF